MTTDSNHDSNHDSNQGAAMERVEAVPAGTFKGQNVMTPHVLAFYRRELRGRTAYVEISEGTGLRGEPIFGVTFRWPGGDRIERDPSACCGSLQAATQHARNAQ